MSTIRFMGFPRGETVSVNGTTVAAWGENPLPEGEIWDLPATPGVSVTINTQRSDHRVAPEAMFFDLGLAGFDTNTLSGEVYDPSYHDKYVFWDYGESYMFTAPTQVLAWDAADGGNRQDSRYSSGPLGSHTFRTPGLYTVRVAVLEPASGKIGFGSADVSIGNPETFYAGSNTIYVDTTGNFANAPGGAQRFTSLAPALSAMDAAATPHRVVLENGQTFELNSMFIFRPPSRATGFSCRIEARDPNGPQPIVRPGANWSGSSFMIDNSERDTSVDSGMVMSGVHFEGLWDTATESGLQIDFLLLPPTGSRHAMFDRCSFSGWSMVFYPTGPRPDRLIAINDVSMTNWGNFGILDSSQSVLAITGCAIAQDENAITGGPTNSDRTVNRHGPIRIAEPTKTLIWASDLFSSTGWSPHGSLTAVQACLRWNSSPGSSPKGCMLNMQACACECASETIRIQSQNNDVNFPPAVRESVNALVEGNIIVAGHQSRSVVETSFGGTTIRNNMIIFAEAPHDSRSIGGANLPMQGFVFGEGGAAGDPDNETTPIDIYNNTMLNLTGISGIPVWGQALAFTDVDVVNNVVHEPNLSTPNIPDAPLNSIVAFTCRYKGYRDNDQALYPQFANGAESAVILFPQLGSAALGAALAEPNASIDLQGDLRPEPPSRGATEAT